MKKSKKKFLIMVAIVGVTSLIIALSIWTKNKIVNNDDVNKKLSSESINIEEYKDKINSIKYKTKDGLLYEDELIQIKTYYKNEETRYIDDNSFSLSEDTIEISDVYIYNKTNKEVNCEIERIKISNYILSPLYASKDIDANDYCKFDMGEIYPASYFVQAMGIGALNNIQVDLIETVSGNDEYNNGVKKTINIETDCKDKAKKFNVADKKVFDKNGIRIYLGMMYISDNTGIAESIKKSISSEYFDNKIIQNSANAYVYVVNENNEDKEITIKVECEDNKEAEKKYFWNGKNEESETISGNSIEEIIIMPDSLMRNWVDKKYEYNPNKVKYTIDVDGKDVAVIDFKGVETK